MGSILRVCSEMVSVMSGAFFMYKLLIQAKQRKLTSLIGNDKEVLPAEIISEILSYLDVKDLLRCKSVSKKWNTLIQDRYFQLREPKSSNFMIITASNFAEISDMPWRYSGILGVCKGLEWRMVVSKPLLSSLLNFLMNWNLPPKWRKISYYIHNRETRQILPLPNLLVDPVFHLGYAFAYIPAAGQYKVAAIIENESMTKCAVLTLGGSEHKWKYFDFPLPHYDQVVPVGADMHCIRNLNQGAKIVHEITTFDLGSDCFTVTIVDKDFLPLMALRIMNWNGSLSFIYQEREEELSVFVLEDYKKIRFAPKFVVPLTFMREERYLNKVLCPVYANDDLLILYSEDGDQIGYDLDSKKVIEGVATAYGQNFAGMRSEVPSVVRLKGMRNYNVFDILRMPRF